MHAISADTWAGGLCRWRALFTGCHDLSHCASKKTRSNDWFSSKSGWISICAIEWCQVRFWYFLRAWSIWRKIPGKQTIQANDLIKQGPLRYSDDPWAGVLHHLTLARSNMMIMFGVGLVCGILSVCDQVWYDMHYGAAVSSSYSRLLNWLIWLIIIIHWWVLHMSIRI